MNFEELQKKLARKKEERIEEMKEGYLRALREHKNIEQP